ncbi:hypothetical protein RAS1_26560 [Phycisphaerae bacterium RAS1]|nr:hypothetical protein RAS1_26560 [Phycisphaerae bacterium RAS1]
MYSDMIKEATGCGDAEAELIEDMMRDVVFHSNLDWKTKEELAIAARLAQATLHFQDSRR